MAKRSVENDNFIDGVPFSGNPHIEWTSPIKIPILSENRLNHSTRLEPQKDPCPILLNTHLDKLGM